MHAPALRKLWGPGAWTCGGCCAEGIVWARRNSQHQHPATSSALYENRFFFGLSISGGTMIGIICPCSSGIAVHPFLAPGPPGGALLKPPRRSSCKGGDPAW